MAFLILMILFIVIALGGLGFSIYRSIKLVKHPMPGTIDYVKELKKLAYIIGGTAIAVISTFIFLASYQQYPLKGGEWVELLVGSLLFGLSFPSFVDAFIIHYYAKEIPEKVKKFLFIFTLSSGIVILLGLWALTTSFADYIDYPLANGINFQEGFVTPASSVKPNLAWYAVCILSGAVLVYFICDHRLYKEYGKHGIIESTFFVAFPAGIIGARVGYVIGEWNSGGFAERVAQGEWWSIFAVWEGGLTIISGALVGIIVGVLWFIWRNKKYSIWVAVDIIVPTILIAQAIGRWGNFFNCEVHGLVDSASNWWFLPKIILNNSVFSESAGFAPEGSIYVPLFFVEFLSNMIGYFIIRFAIGKGLKKYIELGDLAAAYIVWYGLTRVIMEPLRHANYNMGNDGYWSWVWSILFVVIGMFAIFMNHLVRFLIREYKKKERVAHVNIAISIVVSSILLLISLALIIVGSIFMTSSTQSAFLGFNQYNNGLIILCVGLGFILTAAIAIIYLAGGLMKRNKEEKYAK